MNKGLKYWIPAAALLAASWAALKKYILSVQSDIQSRVSEVMIWNPEAPKTVKEIFEGHDVLESMVWWVTTTLVDPNGQRLDISDGLQQYVAAELLRDSSRFCDMLNRKPDGSTWNEYGISVTTAWIGISKHLFWEYYYSLNYPESAFSSVNNK